MITAVCPNCSAQYEVPDDRAGKRADCRKCGWLVEIPEAPSRSNDEPRPRARRRLSGFAIAMLCVWGIVGVGSCIGGGLTFVVLLTGRDSIAQGAFGAVAAALMVALYIVARSTERIFGSIERISGR